MIIADTWAHIEPTTLDWLRGHLGQTPDAVGRYLGEILPSELAALAATQTPLIAIARRSSRVCLGLDAGKYDGAQDAAALVTLCARAKAAGCPLIPRLFLDVEGKPQATPEYLAAWMGQAAAVAIPCVYMPNRVNHEYFGQWAALENAHKFQTCGGVWVAYYPRGLTIQTLKTDAYWSQRCAGPSPESGIDYLAEQAIGNDQSNPRAWFDYSIASPAIDWLSERA